MELLSIFKKFFIATRTGQLLIKFEGAPYLCKVHIERGKALYISMGNKNPEETIAYITGRRPVEANFIDGVPPLKKLNKPLNNTLLKLAGDEGENAGISTQLNYEVSAYDAHGPLSSQSEE